jgi:hypothetical protein
MLELQECANAACHAKPFRHGSAHLFNLAAGHYHALRRLFDQIVNRRYGRLSRARRLHESHSSSPCQEKISSHLLHSSR